MIKIVFTLFVLLMSVPLFAQGIKVSDNLTLHKLTEQCYVHTQGNNNGLVYLSGDEALVVSTPASDIETQNLINWLRDIKGAKITAYIIDRWHTDAMEGLDVVKQNKIKSYSYELTRSIALKKDLPIPDIGFDPKLELIVGGNKVICHFLGASHTSDGIVVYIPSEQILFGGNGIRNNKGWVGNLGDANLGEWCATAERIKKEYGSAKIVIPGHGRYGGPELIDYTIGLYKTDKRNWVLNGKETFKRPEFRADYLIEAASDSIQGSNRILHNAIVTVQDATKYVKIKSPLVVYQDDKNQINSDMGYLEIYDKTDQGDKLRIGTSYKKLIVLKVDDSVGLRIILKEFGEQ